MGALPSSPTRTVVRRLQMKRHQGQAGGGRSPVCLWRLPRRACRGPPHRQHEPKGQLLRQRRHGIVLEQL
jgi:hypothetical protein